MTKANTPSASYHVLGLLAGLFGSALAAELIWEQTWLTWKNGPQMVGFSLAHSTAGLLLGVAPLLLISWIIAILVRGCRILARHCRYTRSDYAHVVAAAIIAAGLLTPYSWWQTLFAARIARGPYPIYALTYAAATGDLRMVKALHTHGVSLTELHNGESSLGAAAGGNEVRVIAYLLDHSVDVNMLDASGDSPLHRAIANHSSDAIAYLKKHGALDVHGTAAQRDSVFQATLDRRMRGDRGR